jgi:lysophospholipase
MPGIPHEVSDQIPFAHTERSLVRPGRPTLHVERFSPPAAVRWNMVTVHGFSAHCALYRHVGAFFAAAGVAVTQFDCRGHGRSEGRRGYVDRFSDFVDDLRDVLQLAKEDAPQAPLVLMGHSHGGTVVLSAALEHGVQADRLVLAAPWLDLVMKVPGWKLAAARICRAVWPTLTMSNEIRPEDVSRNPLVVESFATDPLTHHAATPRWYLEVLDTQARIRAAAARLSTRALLLVAGDDRIVSTAASLAFAEGAPSMEVRRYETLYHELFLEPERAQVLSDIRRWLDS